MQRERTLATVAVVIVVGSALGLAVIPGAIQSHEEPVRPGHIDVEEVTIAAGEVTGGTATLFVTTHVGHRGNPTGNVSVLVRAVDGDTGFVASTAQANRSQLSGDREVAINQSVSVERAGEYRIETILYADGQRVDERRYAVRGVGSLTPAYARSAVEFHRFGETADAIPPIQYGVAGTDDDQVELNVSTYLTNQGDGSSGDLRLVLTARQAESNIVADRTTIGVGAIDPGRTATPSATLAVPDEYNYYLDAVLWKDGVIVGSARSVANLHPTETLQANETRREIGLEVSDFQEADPGERDREPGRPRGDAIAEPTGTAATGPGFGVPVALVALLGLGGLLRRRIQ